MVRHRRWLFGWLLPALLGPIAQASAQQLRVELPDPPGAHAELGRPLLVRLEYRGPAELDDISLQAWHLGFALDRGYARRDGAMQRLRIRLTPRRTGTLTLAPLRLGDAASASHTIEVTAASEDGHRLEPDWRVNPARAWQRQELRAVLTIGLADAAGRLAVGEFAPAGFQVTPLPAASITLDDGRQVHRFAWLLRPLRAGEQLLEAPVLRYIRDGVPRRRFHFPLTRLQVDALPPYLPPTVPVAQLAPAPDAPGVVTGRGIAGPQLVAVLQRAGLPATAVTQRSAEHGTRSEARIDRAAADPAGVGVLYFDPRAGRLHTWQGQPPARTWAGWWWLALPAVLLVWGAWRHATLRRALRLWHYRRLLRQRLRTLPCRAALLAGPLPGQARAPRTLDEWAAQFARCYRLPVPANERLQALLARLAADAFSGCAGSGADPAAELAGLLGRARPSPRG